MASAQIARSPRCRLSPATVRSVMASLEELGLLTRSHPSAGCTPTDSSFRVYIERLARTRPLPPRSRHRISGRISALRRELAEDLGWVAQLVAEATNEAGVAVRPMGEQPSLRAVSLVPLGGARALGVLVTADGAVIKRVVRLETELDRASLQEVANYLSRELVDLPLDRALDTVEANASQDEATLTAARSLPIARALFVEGEADAEVLVAGTDRLIGEDALSGLDRVRSVLEVLEDRRQIVRLWRQALDGERTQVILGTESEVTAPGNLGMVATLFFRGGRRVGAIGVVGPRRMDYLRIVPTVEYIGTSLTTILEGADAGDA